MAFNHDLNDGQKFMGVFALTILAGGATTVFEIPFWVILVCALTMGIGTSFGGWRIIEAVGIKMTWPASHVAGFCSANFCCIHDLWCITIRRAAQHHPYHHVGHCRRECVNTYVRCPMGRVAMHHVGVVRYIPVLRPARFPCCYRCQRLALVERPLSSQKKTLLP